MTDQSGHLSLHSLWVLVQVLAILETDTQCRLHLYREKCIPITVLERPEVYKAASDEGHIREASFAW